MEQRTWGERPPPPLEQHGPPMERQRDMYERERYPGPPAGHPGPPAPPPPPPQQAMEYTPSLNRGKFRDLITVIENLRGQYHLAYVGRQDVVSNLRRGLMRCRQLCQEAKHELRRVPPSYVRVAMARRHRAMVVGDTPLNQQQGIERPGPGLEGMPRGPAPHQTPPMPKSNQMAARAPPPHDMDPNVVRKMSAPR